MKISQATNEEISDYIAKYHTDVSTSNLLPSEQAQLAGEIANALDKWVYVNGLHIHPNKPDDRVASIGTNIVIGLFGFMFFVVVIGVVAYILSVVTL